MKKMKKFLSMLLAMAMVLGMSMTTFAEEPKYHLSQTIEAPREGQSIDVAIKNIGEGQNVDIKAYQIIEAKFDDNTDRFLGYKWAAEYGPDEKSLGADIEVDESAPKVGELTNIVGLTDENITKWAKDPKGTPATDVKYYETEKVHIIRGLTAGTWMVLVTSNDSEHIYNPMVVSVYYKNENEIQGGTVDVKGQWSLQSNGAYAKYTDLSETSATADKKVVEELKKGEYTEAEASAKVGETLTYQLTGLIPSYSNQYETVKYIMMDTKNAGLKYNGIKSVKVGGEPVADDAYELTWYKSYNVNSDTKKIEFGEKTSDVAEANAFSISFTDTYIRDIVRSMNRNVEVIYTAQITKEAISQVAENKFYLDYTRNPGEDGNEKPPVEVEEIYAHTATIKGTVLKVNEKGVNLPGAVFTLSETYNEATMTVGAPFKTNLDSTTNNDPNSAEYANGLAGVQKTGADGIVTFEGLEFGKDYYMQETKAPDGYSINNTLYSVRCDYPDEFDPNGEEALTTYKVTVTNMSIPNSEPKVFPAVPYGGNSVIMTGHEEIVNTSLISLPSTGGIGTTIFTIGGCAIMIITTGLYFSLRRKTER